MPQAPASEFILTLYRMVNDPGSARTLAWAPNGDELIILDEAAFTTKLLPSYFRATNFASFVRQLNLYGFSKRGSHFSHPHFHRDHPEQLPFIKRKTPTGNAAARATTKTTTTRRRPRSKKLRTSTTIKPTLSTLRRAPSRRSRDISSDIQSESNDGENSDEDDSDAEEQGFYPSATEYPPTYTATMPYTPADPVLTASSPFLSPQPAPHIPAIPAPFEPYNLAPMTTTAVNMDMTMGSPAPYSPQFPVEAKPAHIPSMELVQYDPLAKHSRAPGVYAPSDGFGPYNPNNLDNLSMVSQPFQVPALPFPGDNISTAPHLNPSIIAGVGDKNSNHTIPPNVKSTTQNHPLTFNPNPHDAYNPRMAKKSYSIPQDTIRHVPIEHFNQVVTSLEGQIDFLTEQYEALYKAQHQILFLLSHYFGHESTGKPDLNDAPNHHYTTNKHYSSQNTTTQQQNDFIQLPYVPNMPNSSSLPASSGSRNNHSNFTNGNTSANNNTNTTFTTNSNYANITNHHISGQSQLFGESPIIVPQQYNGPQFEVLDSPMTPHHLSQHASSGSNALPPPKLHNSPRPTPLTTPVYNPAEPPNGMNDDDYFLISQPITLKKQPSDDFPTVLANTEHLPNGPLREGVIGNINAQPGAPPQQSFLEPAQLSSFMSLARNPPPQQQQSNPFAPITVNTTHANPMTTTPYLYNPSNPHNSPQINPTPADASTSHNKVV